MGILEEYHGNTMAIPWEHYGNFLEILLTTSVLSGPFVSTGSGKRLRMKAAGGVFRGVPLQGKLQSEVLGDVFRDILGSR